jgi:selenocysteine lyase/cysteine desulfurase
MYPLNLAETPVDFLAADGHKWLLGPEGAGVAVIAKRHLERLRCTNVGWNSVKNAFNYASPKLELRSTAARFESGSANMMGAAALSASLDLFLQVRQQHGETALRDRVVDLVTRLDEQLRAVGAVTRLVRSVDHRSGILTFDVPGVAPTEVRRRALEQKVVVSCRDGGVRASVHVYNDDDDLRRLVDVVRHCLASTPS